MQVYKYTIHEGSLKVTTEEDGAAEATAAGHLGERPDIRRLCGRPGAAPTDGQELQWPDIQRRPEHPAPQQCPDIRRPTPEIWRRLSREDWNGLFQAGHPARAPDIRPPANGRTSVPDTSPTYL